MIDPLGAVKRPPFAIHPEFAPARFGTGALTGYGGNRRATSRATGERRLLRQLVVTDPAGCMAMKFFRPPAEGTRSGVRAGVRHSGQTRPATAASTEAERARKPVSSPRVMQEVHRIRGGKLARRRGTLASHARAMVIRRRRLVRIMPFRVGWLSPTLLPRESPRHRQCPGPSRAASSPQASC